MKNGSKKGAKIKLKSIKKRGLKIDAKRVPKRVQPPTPGRPPRRFPSKKGTVQKENKQTEKQQTIAESWRCFAKVGCIKKGSGAQTGPQHASGACGPERTFGSRGPQGAAPSTRTRQKKEGDGRKKEEPRKKE